MEEKINVFYAEKHKYIATGTRKMFVIFQSLLVYSLGVREVKEWWLNIAFQNRVFSRPSASLSSRQQHLTAALFFLQTHTRGFPSGRLHFYKLRPSAAHDCAKYSPSTKVCQAEKDNITKHTFVFSLQCFCTKLIIFYTPLTLV